MASAAAMDVQLVVGSGGLLVGLSVDLVSWMVGYSVGWLVGCFICRAPFASLFVSVLFLFFLVLARSAVVVCIWGGGVGR